MGPPGGGVGDGPGGLLLDLELGGLKQMDERGDYFRVDHSLGPTTEAN